jgi:pimeloyl-ACP methyl ester carboxylesterase
MTCWGAGQPAVFLESGGGAIDEFSGSPLVERLAAERQVCLYNHAGQSPSDPAPNRAREAEHIAADFHALVQAARIPPPYVLFGRSFGGMVVTFYASKYPTEVAGVVVFDSPAPSATMTKEQFPEGVWNYPGNVEHLNVLTGYENRFGTHPVLISAPLILISPTHGESTPDDRYWLQTSADASQVILQGGTEVIDTQADKVAEQVLSLSRP